MLNRLSYGPPTSPLIIRHADGSTEGVNPLHVAPADLADGGHTSKPLLRVVREKCLDCSGGSRTEVAACTAVGCPLWPYRKGENPFANARGRSYTGPERSSEKLPQTAAVFSGADPSKAEGQAS
jgi:hypothetical protein